MHDGACGIERISGAPPARTGDDGRVVAAPPVGMSGWAFAPDAATGIPEVWLRLRPVEAEAPPIEQRLVPYFPRPDVVAARGAPRAAYSGFDATIDAVPRGRYDIELVFASTAGHWVCDSHRVLEVE
jgi:hypothetical protein